MSEVIWLRPLKAMWEVRNSTEFIETDETITFETEAPPEQLPAAGPLTVRLHNGYLGRSDANRNFLVSPPVARVDYFLRPETFASVRTAYLAGKLPEALFVECPEWQQISWTSRGVPREVEVVSIRLQFATLSDGRRQHA